MRISRSTLHRLSVMLLTLLITVPPGVNTTSAKQLTAQNGKIAFVATGKDEPRTVYIVDPDDTNLRTIGPARLAYWAENLVWSPDHHHLAFAEYTSTVNIVDVNTLTTRTIDGYYTQEPQWSPDSKYLAVVAQPKPATSTEPYGLYLMNADGTNMHRLLKSRVTQYSWMPDSQHVAVVLSGDIYTVNVEGQVKLNRLTVNDREPFRLRSSPDGNYISFYVNNGLFAVQTSTKKRYPLGNFNWNTAYRWSPDGKRLALFTPAGSLVTPFEISILQIDSLKKRLLIKECTLGDVEWSSDNRHIACLSAYSLVVVDADTGQYKTIDECGGACGLKNGIDWSPDGTQLAMIKDNTICIVTIENASTRCMKSTMNLWSTEFKLS